MENNQSKKPLTLLAPIFYPLENPPPGSEHGREHPRKPGLYDQFFTPEEIRDLTRLPEDDFSNELVLLRDLFADYINSLSKPSALADWGSRLACLRAVSMAVYTVGRLITHQLETHSPVMDIEQQIQQGIELARQYLRLDDFWGSVGEAFVPHRSSAELASSQQKLCRQRGLAAQPLSEMLDIPP